MDEPMMEVECDGDEEEEEMEEIEEEEEIEERGGHGSDLIPGLPAPPAFGDQQNGEQFQTYANKLTKRDKETKK